MTPQERLALLQRLAGHKKFKGSPTQREALSILKSLQDYPPITTTTGLGDRVTEVFNPRLGMHGASYDGTLGFSDFDGSHKRKQISSKMELYGVRAMMGQVLDELPVGSKYNFTAYYDKHDRDRGKEIPQRANAYYRNTKGVMDGRNFAGEGGGIKGPNNRWYPNKITQERMLNAPGKGITWNPLEPVKHLARNAMKITPASTVLGQVIGHPLVQGAMTVFDLVNMATDGGASKQVERMMKDPKAFFNYEALPKPATLIP